MVLEWRYARWMTSHPNVPCANSWCFCSKCTICKMLSHPGSSPIHEQYENPRHLIVIVSVNYIWWAYRKSEMKIIHQTGISCVIMLLSISLNGCHLPVYSKYALNIFQSIPFYQCSLYEQVMEWYALALTLCIVLQWACCNQYLNGIFCPTHLLANSLLIKIIFTE